MIDTKRIGRNQAGRASHGQRNANRNDKSEHVPSDRRKTCLRERKHGTRIHRSTIPVLHHSIRAPAGRAPRINCAKQSQFAGGQTNDKPCLYGELWEKTPGCASAKTKPICRGGGWWAQPTLHEGLRRHCAKQSQFAEPGLLRRCASRNDRKGRGARRAKQSQFAGGQVNSNCSSEKGLRRNLWIGAARKTKPICRGGGWWAQPTLHKGPGGTS